MNYDIFYDPSLIFSFHDNYPMGMFLLVTMPLYAFAMLCLSMIQFLDFKRSKWLLPIFAGTCITLATFVFKALAVSKKSGEEGFLNDTDLNFLNGYTKCLGEDHPKGICADPPSLCCTPYIWVYLVFDVYFAVIIAAASAIGCCLMYLCYRFRQNFKDSCFPMINKMEYDTEEVH